MGSLFYLSLLSNLAEIVIAKSTKRKILKSNLNPNKNKKREQNKKRKRKQNKNKNSLKRVFNNLRNKISYPIINTPKNIIRNNNSILDKNHPINTITLINS